MSEVALYLSGSIKKGASDSRDTFWTDDDIATLRRTLAPLDVHMLNPASRSDDLGDFLGTFGRDLFQVAAADAVIVDVRDRRGIGVGSEMTVAKASGVPVISLCPRESHYRRSDFLFMDQQLPMWTHPFVFGLSDVIVETLDEACQWIRSERVWERAVPRVIPFAGDTVEEAVRHYLRTQLARDVEMRELVNASPRLREKSGTWAETFDEAETV